MPLARAKPSAAGHPRLGHPHHHVGLGRRLNRQQLAHAAAGLVDLAAVEPAVGPRDVGELEDAQARLHVAQPRDLDAGGALGVDHHHLARRHLAHEGGTDDAQRRRLRGQHPARGRVGRAEPAQAERAEPVGVAHAEQPLGAHEHEGERALEDRAARPAGRWRGPRSRGRPASAARPRRRCRWRSNPAASRPSRPARRCWSGSRCARARSRPGPPGGTRVGRRPSRRLRASSTGCGRWRDAPASPESVRSSKTVATRPMSLTTVTVSPSAHRHAGRLLPAVLQGEETVEREVGHPHPGRVDPEDSAGFLHAPPILAQARAITGRPGPGPGSPRAPGAGRRAGGRPGCPG